MRCSWTGGDRGWMMNTSASRQLAWSWTLRQSLLNRAMAAWLSGLFKCLQIDFASRACAFPLKTTMWFIPAWPGASYFSRTRRVQG
jgi:hypothetical protein